jgi:hypothetical protein
MRSEGMPLIIGGVDRHVEGADEKHAALDGNGFLDLAATTGTTPAADLAGWSASFVLLAAGGVGKSVVLDDLRRLEDGCPVELVGLRGGPTSAGQSGRRLPRGSRFTSILWTRRCSRSRPFSTR